MTEREKYYIFVITLLMLAVLCIAFFAESREYRDRMTAIEEKLEKQTQLAEEEYQQLRQQQLELIERNERLEEKLQRYEKLDAYIENSLNQANNITQQEIDELTSLIWKLIKQYDFEPEKVISWIEQESGFKITAISYKGATGLTQLMPRTAEEVARKLGIEWQGRKTLLNPKLNLIIGFYHLNWSRECSINEHQTFSMYFWGYGNVKRRGLVETAYSQDIFKRSEMLMAEMRSV